MYDTYAQGPPYEKTTFFHSLDLLLPPSSFSPSSNHRLTLTTLPPPPPPRPTGEDRAPPLPPSIDPIFIIIIVFFIIFFSHPSMRKLCPNFDKENGLDTVLEVPIPEEMFINMGTNAALRWQNLRALMKAQSVENVNKSSSHLSAASNNEFMALLKLVGSPLIPFQVHLDLTFNCSFRDYSIVSASILYLYNSGFFKFVLQMIKSNVPSVGGVDGEVHCAAVCGGDGRPGGVELGEQYVCGRAGENGGIGDAARGGECTGEGEM